MRIARFTTTLIAVVLALSTALRAEAATFTITIVSKTQSFSPPIASHDQGITFSCPNGDSITRTSTQDGALALKLTGFINGAATKSRTVASAGAYPYHCAIHPTMTGTVKVPIKLSATTGTTSTTFTITMATTAATGSFVYDVQERVGTGAWTNYMTGVTAKSVSFKPSTTGTFSFRSRLRNTSVANAASGYSPKKMITVT